MSSKSGMSMTIGSAKNCFEYRGGRGGLCADYQFRFTMHYSATAWKQYSPFNKSQPTQVL